MSAKIKEGVRNHCSVCDISLNSDAEFAIHEFSKKHCDNLLRVSKNKPIKPKTQKPTENQPAEKGSVEPVQVVTEPGQFALYGYFTPGEEGESKNEYAPKEYNYDYDPYLQKLAENPYKAFEKKAAEAAAANKDEPAVPLTNVTSFSTSKKKKKRTCQVCNVSMMNIPQYEAHMKSPQHAYKLKQTGMGVSAHFVKAGADLHTTEGTGEEGSGAESSGTSVPVPIAPSELFCEICEMLLNSQSQYEAHLTGKSHKDKVQLKETIMAKKEKNETPTPDKLYCYSCKLTLNNVTQYYDHKNGKKHRIKCKTLVKNGITIPPEERGLDMHWAYPSSAGPVRYPELYMEQASASDTKVQADAVQSNGSAVSKTVVSIAAIGNVTENSEGGNSEKIPGNEGCLKEKNEAKELQEYKCSQCECNFAEQSSFETHLNSEEHAVKLMDLRKSGKTARDILLKLLEDRRVILPDRQGRYICGVCAVISTSKAENEQHLKSTLHKFAEQKYEKERLLEIRKIVNAESDGSYKCQICNLSWSTLFEYNTHLHEAQHKNLSWADYTRKRGYPFRPGTNAYEERNPGVRTKVGGVARDLSNGEIEPVPNLEQLEPRIDPAKNVNIGLRTGWSESPKKKRFLSSSYGGPRMPFRDSYPPPFGWPREPTYFPPYRPEPPPPPPRYYPMRPRMPPPFRPPAWY